MSISSRCQILTHILKRNIQNRLAANTFTTLLRSKNAQKPALKTNSRNYFFGFFKRKGSEALKEADSVSSDFCLIYRSTFEKYLILTQVITMSSAVTLGAIMVFRHDFQNYSIESVRIFEEKPKPIKNEIYIYLTVFFTLAIMTQLFVSRIPVRIYNSPEKRRYIFVFQGNVPLTKKKVYCNLGDLKKIEHEHTGIIPWRDNMYLLKNIYNVLIMVQHFRRPADLFILLGLQKDPDYDDQK